MPLLLGLKEMEFSHLIKNISLLRIQTILVCRLLCLYRSHDLASMKRTVSIVEGKIPFVKIKRKGQNVLKWERLLSLPNFPQISPFHLLQAYVSLTHLQGEGGGPFSWPFTPLSNQLQVTPLLLSPKKSCKNLVFLRNFGGPTPQGGQGLVC